MSYWYVKIRIFHMKFCVFSSPLKVGYLVLGKHMSTWQEPLDITRGCTLPPRHAHSSSSQTLALFIGMPTSFSCCLPFCLLPPFFLLFLFIFNSFLPILSWPLQAFGFEISPWKWTKLPRNEDEIKTSFYSELWVSLYKVIFTFWGCPLMYYHEAVT